VRQRNRIRNTIPAGYSLAEGDGPLLLPCRRGRDRDGRIVAAGDWHGAVHLWEVATEEGILQFKGHEDSVKSLQFAPDGRSVLSGGVDTTVLVWDVTGRALGGGGPREDPNAEQLAAHWAALAGAKAPEAHRAVWALVGSPGQSVPFLGRHL